METFRRPRRLIAAIVGLGMGLSAASTMVLAPPSEARAGWFWKAKHPPACGHHRCPADHCLAPAGWAGQWYWMRSADQEQRVVMSLFNRYCIRCHSIDGRGVWDIPDIPDFTDPRWQASRSDAQIVTILMEGRGAVMPAFRGTITLEEAWAMAHYLRSFVLSRPIARPDVGRAAIPPPGTSSSSPAAAAISDLPPLPAPVRPAN